MAVADQSRWNFTICAMDGSLPAGTGRVLNGTNKQFSYHINSGRTAQLTIGIDNPRANYILNHDCLLKVYRQTKVSRTNQLLMVGDIIHAEESAQGNSGILTVVAADPWWRLQYRFLGLGVDSKGRGIGITFGTSGSPVDIGQAMFPWILGLVNADAYVGITMGTTQASTTSYIGPLYAQNVGQLIQQLCAVLGAPDFEIAPTEPISVTGGTQLGVLNTYTRLGTTRSNTRFEYGTGTRTAASYDRLLSKDGICNRAISLPSGWPTATAIGDQVVVYSDATSIATIGLYQDVLPNDVQTVGLRMELCQENVTVRKQARQQIIITPTVDCPYDYGIDYAVGDTVGVRAKVAGSTRFDGTARIYGVDFTIDDNDAETPALVMIPGG